MMIMFFLIREKKGASLIEYALLVSAISLGTLASLVFFGEDVERLFSRTTPSFLENTICSPEAIADGTCSDEPILVGVNASGETVFTTPVDAPRASWPNAYFFCESLVAGGHTDWRLPTEEEALLMRSRRAEIGNFTDDPYWTSSESSGTTALAVRFSDGNPAQTNKSEERDSRCVRTATGS